MTIIGKDGTWYATRGDLRDHSLVTWRAFRHNIDPSATDEVYAYNCFDLERAHPPETPDERLQRVERCMLALTEEWLELTGRKEPPRIVEFDITNGDLDQLRSLRVQLHRMAVVDRENGPFRGTFPHVSGDLRAMIRALDGVIDNVDGARSGAGK